MVFTLELRSWEIPSSSGSRSQALTCADVNGEESCRGVMLQAFAVLGWDSAECKSMSRTQLASKCRMARAEVHPDRVHADEEDERTLLRRAQEINAALDTVLRECKAADHTLAQAHKPHETSCDARHEPSWLAFGSGARPAFAHPWDLGGASAEGVFDSIFSEAPSPVTPSSELQGLSGVAQETPGQHGDMAH